MPNSTPPVKTVTRQNSASFTLLDIQKIIAESEERITANVNRKFDILSAKIDSLETALSEVKAVQVRQESDMAHIKEIIVSQQHQIEVFEERKRNKNLIFSNVPETDVTFEGSNLSTDIDKVKSLVDSIIPETASFDSDDIQEVTRIGRGGGRSPRILKVRVANINCRNQILFCSRNLNANDIRTSFGRVYINKDMSALRRLEEKRLRDHFKQLKVQYPNEVRLRSGTLFLGPAIKDRVDFRNQLF